MSQLWLQHAVACPVPDVAGLSYVEDYLSMDEERLLIERIDREPWSSDWQRRRQVYGLSYGSTRPSAEATALPGWLAPLCARLVRDGWLEREVANAVINEYLPGQGISAHRDQPGFGPTVAALSLGAPYVLDLFDPSGPDRAKRSIDLKPRSLLVLGGLARSHWLHGIARRQADQVGGARRPRGRRISVTLRTRA